MSAKPASSATETPATSEVRPFPNVKIVPETEKVAPEAEAPAPAVPSIELAVAAPANRGRLTRRDTAMLPGRPSWRNK